MVRFRDRADAGRRLAPSVASIARADTVVVGLPRGGVIVAAEVARLIDAPLDIIIVQKVGHPDQPELAIGALGEGGVDVLDEFPRAAAVSPDSLERAVRLARSELERRVDRFRAASQPVGMAGVHLVIVDDGIATGASAIAACRVARAAGTARISLAVPVAPPGWERQFEDLADDLISLATPHSFGSVGRFYTDFRQTTDEEVLACLAAAERRIAP